MKKYCKLLTLLVIFISFTGSLFADGFFGERIFELRVENDVGLSNNSIAIGDYLKKDLVIDLPKLAAETPDTGFEFSLYEKPTFSTKINFGSFSTRLSMGVDSLFNMNISKDLIDFLGNGNEVGEEINTKVDMVGDVFAFFDLDVKAKNSLFKYSITPSVFIPVMHIANKKSYVNISNTEDG